MGAGAVGSGVAGLQPHQVVHAADLELSGVLDGDDALIPGDEVGQGIEEGGLAGAGAAADKDVVPGPHQQLQHLGHLRRDGAVGDELLHGHGLLGEAPDGDHRAVEGHRRHHHVDAGAVLQVGVYNGLTLVDHPPGLGDELGDDGLQFLPAFKVVLQLAQAAVLLHEDVLIAVDHHFGDVGVGDDLAQHTQAADGLKHRAG